jgi:hypothetical protein
MAAVENERLKEVALQIRSKLEVSN